MNVARRAGAALLLCAAGFAPALARAQERVPSPPPAPVPAPVSTPGPPDLSGHARVGKASFYAARFAGRRMADGARMDPHADNAASRTLPLGTTAKVTNVQTGQSAVVTIQDRGPYVKGRIVDLSPSTARKVGITSTQGIAKVEVAPLLVPLPNGSTRQGDAAQALVRQDAGAHSDTRAMVDR